MFENDPRFKALEDDREREDMFEDYLLDLEKKEKEEKKRERKKHMDAFRAFLETCDFIKVCTGDLVPLCCSEEIGRVPHVDCLLCSNAK